MSSKVVILENIRSLHNVGAIFRTADSSGFEKVYLCGYTGTPDDPRVAKVSLGAEDFVSWEYHEDINSCLEKLKKEGYTLMALEQTSKAQDILKYTHTEDSLALVVGNEVDGISGETLRQCPIHLEIPQRGQKGSLNVSVATGIAMYQLGD